MSQKNAPEICSIAGHEPEAEICSIHKNASDDHPEACAIPGGTPIHSNVPKRVSIGDVQAPGDIADTYGTNVPVSAEERAALLDGLRTTGVAQSSPISKTLLDLNLSDHEQEIVDKDKGLRGGQRLPVITIVKNGPYILYGAVPVQNAVMTENKAEAGCIGFKREAPFTIQNIVALCRCGQSKDMPFCDGSHEYVQFDGTCTAENKPYDEAAKVYRGCAGHYLMDAEDLCAIVRYCDPDGSCWNLIKSATTIDNAIKQTTNCCSGRLTVIKNGKKIEPDLAQEIDCLYDGPKGHMGPLWVKGGIPVQSEDTDYEVRNRVTLCRCGKSKNKPFCDGAHLKEPKRPHITEKPNKGEPS